ncbi:restriction endonuclease subunit S, partial [Helicobacter suis]
MQKALKELRAQGVEWVELGEIFNIKNGYTPSKSRPEFWQGGTIPWFRM